MSTNSMGIRIQPRDIEVPSDDPFKNDLLDREKPIEVLTHLIGSFEGPCVLAVDAEWGNGKTTFLRIWAQYLRNQQFPVVEFNAWETDFSEDPFVTLSMELTEGLQAIGNGPMRENITEVKKYAKEVIRRAIPGVIRLATAGILDINPLLEKEVGNTFASYAEEKLSAYGDAKESIKRFRCALQDMAAGLSKANDGKPLVVIIDELDRCRPSYAVELLEVAKHLFTVDHVVFVLAVNRSELVHSIKALYGSDFDAQGYLRRFFDVDFRLPAPKRDMFISKMLSATQIDDYIERTEDSEAQIGTIQRLLYHFFNAHNISLRTIAQSIHCLGLVFASLRNDQQSFMQAAIVALILRTIDADLYYRFIRREVSDLEVVDEVFGRPETSSFQMEREGWFFEVVIIMAAQELFNTVAKGPYDSMSSPLYERYQDMIENEATREVDRSRAGYVINLTKEQFGLRAAHLKRIGFVESVERLELLSSNLLPRE